MSMPFHFLRKYSAEELKPIAEFFDVALSFDWFPEVAEDVFNGITRSVGDDQICAFYDPEEDEEFYEDVKFVSDPFPYGESYKEYRMPLDQFYPYLAEACSVFLEENPHDKRVKDLLAQVEEKVKNG